MTRYTCAAPSRFAVRMYRMAWPIRCQLCGGRIRAWDDEVAYCVSCGAIPKPIPEQLPKGGAA